MVIRLRHAKFQAALQLAPRSVKQGRKTKIATPILFASGVASELTHQAVFHSQTLDVSRVLVELQTTTTIQQHRVLTVQRERTHRQRERTACLLVTRAPPVSGLAMAVPPVICAWKASTVHRAISDAWNALDHSTGVV